MPSYDLPGCHTTDLVGSTSIGISFLAQFLSSVGEDSGRIRLREEENQGCQGNAEEEMHADNP